VRDLETRLLAYCISGLSASRSARARTTLYCDGEAIGRMTAGEAGRLVALLERATARASGLNAIAQTLGLSLEPA
jgi:hypothetical protein